MRPKVNIDLSWVNNLWEVGAPIRDEAREIQWRQEQARERLELAKLEFEESMRCCELSANTLEARIKTLWSSEEIAAAKRGVILAT